MAKLLHINTKKTVPLRSQHIFGRHPGGSNTLLTNTEASRLHASIQWNGRIWSIQDTSQNGTFVNGNKIPKGLKNELQKDDLIHFGSTTSSPWQLIDNDDPKSLLIPVDATIEPIELSGIVVLPDENHPQITLYQTSNEQWLYEDQTGITKLKPGVTVSIDKMSWYFVSAETLESTKALDQNDKPFSSRVEAQFSVSQNEEHVSLSLLWQNQTINLGERVHHYLILILARKHLSDSAAGIEKSEQGWLDKDIICHETGLEESHINIQIYRLRRQLIQAQPNAQELLQIIARRRREIRIVVDSIKIE
jgi:hypothetical protein